MSAASPGNLTKSHMELPEAPVAKAASGECVAFAVDETLFEDGIGSTAPKTLSESLKMIGIAADPADFTIKEMTDQGPHGLMTVPRDQTAQSRSRNMAARSAGKKASM
jgi:hypothetical protein